MTASDSREESTTGHTKEKERVNGGMNQQIKEEQAMETEDTYLDDAVQTTNCRSLTSPLLQCSH